MSTVVAAGLFEPRPTARADSTPSPACVSAAITDLQLAASAEVDEIRVQLSSRSPRSASLQVTVESSESDRVIEVDGVRYKALQFSPAMNGDEYRISLFPGAKGEDPACLDSVELLSGGESVALFRP